MSLMLVLKCHGQKLANQNSLILIMGNGARENDRRNPHSVNTGRLGLNNPSSKINITFIFETVDLY